MGGDLLVLDGFRSAKRERRKAERRWIFSGLTVHKQIYDATKMKVTSLVHSAKPHISAQRSLKVPHTNNCLALPTNCCLEVNLHLYQLQCLLKNSPIFSANISRTKMKILEINLTATHLLIPHHHSTTIQFFMAILLRHSSQSLQTHYGLYSTNFRPNDVLLTQSQHHYCLDALTQSCRY